MKEKNFLKTINEKIIDTATIPFPQDVVTVTVTEKKSKRTVILNKNFAYFSKNSNLEFFRNIWLSIISGFKYKTTKTPENFKIYLEINSEKFSLEKNNLVIKCYKFQDSKKILIDFVEFVNKLELIAFISHDYNNKIFKNGIPSFHTSPSLQGITNEYIKPDYCNLIENLAQKSKHIVVELGLITECKVIAKNLKDLNFYVITEKNPIIEKFVNDYLNK